MSVTYIHVNLSLYIPYIPNMTTRVPISENLPHRLAVTHHILVNQIYYTSLHYITIQELMKEQNKEGMTEGMTERGLLLT